MFWAYPLPKISLDTTDESNGVILNEEALKITGLRNPVCIRKILGASVPKIVVMLSRDFLKWVLGQDSGLKRQDSLDAARHAP